MPEGGLIGDWVVSGASFEAQAETEFKENHGPLEVGAYVKVKYYVSGDVKYATRIETKNYDDDEEEEEEHELYGFVESMPEGGLIGVWMVSGASFEATDSTNFKENDGPLEEGAYVKVKYYVSSDVNYATKIETKGYNDEKHKLHGFVKSMPEVGFIGAWEVEQEGNVTSFEATDSTEFEEDEGLLEVGAYVEVEYYVSGGVKYATEIETEDHYVPSQVVARLQPGVNVEDIHSDYHTWTVDLLPEQVYLLGLEPGGVVLGTLARNEGKGGQWDAEVVEAFLKTLEREMPYQLTRSIMIERQAPVTVTYRAQALIGQ